MELEKLYTADELGEIISRSPVTLRKDRAAGRGIPYTLVCGRPMYRPSIVQQYLEEQTVETAA